MVTIQNMKLLTIAAIVIAFTTGCALNPIAVGPDVRASYIVQGESLESVASLVKRQGGEITHELGVIRAVAAELTAVQVETLRGLPGVRRVYGNGPVEVSGKGGIDRRTDVYALGVTLYECLTCHTPFESDRRESLYRQILTEVPPNPTTRNSAVGRDLRAVLEKALEKEPRRRFPSALEFAEELRRIRCHEPIHTRAPGPALRTLRWCQRNPAATTVLVTVVVALAISLVLLQKSRRAEARSRAQALISEARATQPTDPELAFKLGREALDLDPDNPKIMASVQSAMLDLRPYRVVRDVGTETGARGAHLEFVKYSPDGKYFVLAGLDVRPSTMTGCGSSR